MGGLIASNCNVSLNIDLWTDIYTFVVRLMWHSSAGDFSGWHRGAREHWSPGFHFSFFSIACVCTPCDFTVWMQADGSKALDKRPIEDKVGEKMWWFLTSNQHVLVFVVRFIVLEGDFRHDWRGVCGVCWGLPTPVGGHTASIVFFILASRMSRACYNSGVSQWCWLEVRLGRWGGFILLLMVSATVWIMS